MLTHTHTHTQKTCIARANICIITRLASVLFAGRLAFFHFLIVSSSCQCYVSPRSPHHHTGQPTARSDDGLAERFLASLAAAQRLLGWRGEHAAAAGQHPGARRVRRLRAKGECLVPVPSEIDGIAL